MIDQKSLDECAEMLGAMLGDPTRLRIALMVEEAGELQSGETHLTLGADRNWSGVSEHLIYLKRFGVATTRKEAQRVIYFPGAGQRTPRLTWLAQKLPTIFQDVRSGL